MRDRSRGMDRRIFLDQARVSTDWPAGAKWRCPLWVAVGGAVGSWARHRYCGRSKQGFAAFRWAGRPSRGACSRRPRGGHSRQRLGSERPIARICSRCSVTAASVPAAPILVLGADVGAAEPQDSDDESESVDLYLYYVQAKAFNAREKAESFRTKILAAGQDALVVKRGGRFFVRMGPYPSREQAEGMKNDLATVGCECELVRVAQ